MSERDKAIEEAKRSCEHNWLTNYLIPLCSECGFTEDGFRHFNRGVERGFNAALDYHAKQNAEKLAKLEAFVNGLAEVGWRHTDGLWASILWCDDIYWVRTERRKWADGKTPLEAIYAYLEQAEGGKE